MATYKLNHSRPTIPTARFATPRRRIARTQQPTPRIVLATRSKAMVRSIASGRNLGAKKVSGTIVFDVLARTASRTESQAKAKALVIRSAQSSLPNGCPRLTHRRSDSSSALLSARLTRVTQSFGISIGHLDRSAGDSASPNSRRQRLDHCQYSALAQPGTQGIALHVTAHRPEVLVRLHQERLITPLVHVARPHRVPMGVPALGVRQLQPADERRQIPIFAWPNHEMPMVWQNAVGQQPHLHALHGLPEDFLECLIVLRLVKYSHSRVCAVEHVVREPASDNP